MIQAHGLLFKKAGFLLAVLFFFQCGTAPKKPAPVPISLVVIFSSSDARLTREDSKPVGLKVGMGLKEGDRIKTGRKGPVDLQFRDGSSLRIRSFADVTIGKLLKGNRSFSLNNGSVLARVKRNSRSDEFKISTPTSIASVRGTTFSVEVDEGRNPVVRVLKGRVAFKARIAALKQLTDSEKKELGAEDLEETLKESEVILESETEGKLSPELEKQVVDASNVIIRTKKEGQDVKKALQETKQKIKANKNGVSTQKKKITPQEDAEIETLISVEISLLEQLDQLDNQKINEKKRKAVIKKIAATYQKEVTSAIERVEKAATAKNLKSEKDIQAHYDLLEVVTLKNGKKKSGAVIAQAGNILILHTAKGVSRINKKEVNFVDMFQTK